MTIEQLNKSKVPIIVFDKRLEQFKGKVQYEPAKNKHKKPTILKVDKTLDNYLKKNLFKEKVDKANYILKTVGLPKFSK